MAYGTVEGSVGPKTGHWETKPGVDECVLIDVDGVLGTAEFFTGGYCRRAEEQGLFGGGEFDLFERDDDGGGYYEPPTGANEIQLVFSKEIGGHHVRIWTYGLLIRVSISGEDRFYRLPDINRLVLLIDAIKRKYGVP